MSSIKLDVNGISLNGTNGVLIVPTTEPISPVMGQTYTDSTSGKLRHFDGVQWNDCY